MRDQKLLPRPAPTTAYGEPWREGRGGCLVSDTRGIGFGRQGFGGRAYYGGTLLAESMSRRLARRAADCVNFCAGVEFSPGTVYVGALADVLDALEDLHSRLPEPDTPVLNASDRERFEYWRAIDDLLRMFGRDAASRERRHITEVAW